MAGGKVQFSQIDIRDEAAITDHIANGKYDCIVHLAAISRVVDGEKDKPNCIQTNYVGTRARREKLLGDRRFLSLPEGIRQTLTLYKNLYRNDELKG